MCWMNISEYHILKDFRKENSEREYSLCLAENLEQSDSSIRGLEHDETGWIIKAEVYGDGVDIWLRGQGNIIEVLDGGKNDG